MAATISVDLNARIANFETEMKKATGTLDRFGDNASRVASGISRTFGALGVGLSVSAFAGLIKGAIDAQDHLNDLSKTTQISIENLSGLSLAAKQSGSDLDGTASAINKLAVNMGKNAEKFAAIGITAKDPLKAFGQLADVFNQIEDPQKRAAFAMEALGKSWQDAAPLLSEGSVKIDAMVKKGRELSGVTKESAQRADEFNDRLGELSARAGNFGVEVANPLVKGILNIAKEFDSATTTGEKFKALLANWPASIKDKLGLGKEWEGSTGKLGKNWVGTTGTLGEKPPAKPTKKALADFIGNSSSAAVDKAKQAYDSLIKSIREKISVQDAELNSTFKITDAAKEYAKFLSNVVDGTLKLSPKQLTNLAPMWDEFLRKADELQAKQRDIATNAARLQIGDLQQGFSGSNAGLADAQKIMSESARRLADSLRSVDEQGRHTGDVFRNLFNDGKIDADQYQQLIKELTGALDKQKGTVAALEAAQQELNSSWAYGANKALQIYLDDVTNVAKQAEDLFTRAFGGMEDALVNFVKTGKLDFKSLADSIISDLIRIQIRQSITAPLAKAIDGFNVGDFFSGLFGGGKASGGSVDSGKYYLVGENGPELFAPGRSGSIIPNESAFGGGGMVVNIIESPGNGGQQQQRSVGGVNILDVFVEQVKSSIASDISRGSGVVPAAMSGTYGLNRAVGAY
mgnify:CR=1 FL=1